LQYARAEEVAMTLSEVAPPGVRAVPYPPTNSVLLAGPSAAVTTLTRVLTPKASAVQAAP